MHIQHVKTLYLHCMNVRSLHRLKLTLRTINVENEAKWNNKTTQLKNIMHSPRVINAPYENKYMYKLYIFRFISKNFKIFRRIFQNFLTKISSWEIDFSFSPRIFNRFCVVFIYEFPFNAIINRFNNLFFIWNKSKFLMFDLGI